MSQQINLFNPLFRKKGFSFTSATAMLYGAGIAVAVMAMAAVYADQNLRAARVTAQAIDAEYKVAVAQRDKLAAEIAQQKPNAQLEKELSELDATLQGRQEIVETLKSGAIGNTQGFSDYMLAFSRQNVNGLWLTGFDVALAGNELAIQGRTLNADLVAKYLARLNQEKALNGRQFGALRISRQTETPIAASTPADPAKKSDAPAPKEVAVKSLSYLEFSISTIALPDSAKAGAKVEAAPSPLLGTVDAGAVLERAKALAAGGAK